MISKLEVDFNHSDERGKICQILSIPNSQVNYLFTKKGGKRGQHYHKKNKEIFYIISGKIKIDAYEVANHDKKADYIFEDGDLFMVEPFVMHNFTFLEDTQMVVIYDLGVEKDNEKDIFTE